VAALPPAGYCARAHLYLRLAVPLSFVLILAVLLRA